MLTVLNAQGTPVVIILGIWSIGVLVLYQKLEAKLNTPTRQ